MPKNEVDAPIPAQEMAFALLVFSETMTDREAAEVAGLYPDTAAHILSKPRVQAFIHEHRARVQQKRAAEREQGLSQANQGRDPIMARLWELANFSPEATRGSIAGQVKVMTLIVAIEGLIPDRRRAQTQNQPATPLPKPQIYVSEWRRQQKEREAQGLEPLHAAKEDQAATAEAPNPEPTPQPALDPANSSSPDQSQSSTMNREAGSWVPDAANGTIFDPRQNPPDPRAPLWMRMKKRRPR
jgi:hypothetical protein